MEAVKAPRMPTGTTDTKERKSMSDMGTSGTMKDCSAIKIEAGDTATAEMSRIENAFKAEPMRIMPDEKTVPVPIEQYANMILSMQKLEDIRSIVRQAGYIGENPNTMIDDDDALLSIAAIFQGGNA